MKPPADNSSRSRSNHVTGSVVESIFVFLPLYHLLLKTSPDNVKHDKHNHGLSCSLSPLLAAVMSPLCFYLLKLFAALPPIVSASLTLS